MNRRNLIVAGLVVWTIATALCGLATGFAGLLAARALVGAGEAALSPAAVSTIGDRFPPERLGSAAAIYSAGVTLGGGVAMAFGGALAQWAEGVSLHLPLLGTLSGWRLTLVVVGALGLPLAAFLLATVREAPRRDDVDTAPPFAVLLAHARTHRGAFTTIMAGYGLVVLATYLPLLWGPALLMRVHGLSVAQAGLMMGAIAAGGGLVGVAIGGVLADRMARRGRADGAPLVMAWASAAMLPFLLLGYLAPVLPLAGAGLLLGMVGNAAFGGLQAAVIQLVTPPRMRGRMMAIYLLCVTMVGMGLGPLLVGVLSDRVFPGAFGFALATATAVSLAPAVLLLWRGHRHIRETIAAQLTAERA